MASDAILRPRNARLWLEAIGVALLVLAHAWLALTATREKSTTVDEIAHLMAGYAMWAGDGDYRLQPENGVLPQLWEALPSYLRKDRIPPPSHPAWSQPNVWTLGHVYFHRLGNNLDRILFTGRAMNLVWSVGVGLLIYAWSRRLFGVEGAAVALLFWAMCPTFLAHGALATSDLCMTFFFLASVSAYGWHLQRFHFGSMLVSAGVLGLACVAKYSAVLLPPMLVLLAALRVASDEPLPWRGQLLGRRRTRAAALVASGVLHAAVAVLVIWAFFRFRFEPSADGVLPHDYTRPWATVLSSLGGHTADMLTWFRTQRLLPDAYLYGFAFVLDLSQERGAYLNGATSMTGWALFFPYAFLVKTPLGLLVAAVSSLGFGGYVLARGGSARARILLHSLAPLLVLFAVYWAFSLTSRLNIGHRHLLPTYPVVLIATGVLGAAAFRKRWRPAAALAAASLLLHAGASAAVRPHYLAFFNTFASGPEQGYRHLVDSSLDWGQDLPGLARWLREQKLPRPEAPVYLAYFGTGDPEHYGIEATPMVPLLRSVPDQPWHALRPGVYCISATLLSQAYSPIREVWSAGLEQEYQNLRSVEPAFIDYRAHPERREQWHGAIAAEKWPVMWQRYEQLRFTRLCYFLRTREPDAQIGYSINIYVLSDQDIAAATTDAASWRRALESAASR